MHGFNLNFSTPNLFKRNSRTEDLSTAINFSEKRLNEIVDNYNNTNNFFSEHFAKSNYRTFVDSFIINLKKYICSNAKDLTGKSLIKEGDFEIRLDNSFYVANAKIEKDNNDKLIITLTLGLFVLVDLLQASVWVHKSEITGEHTKEDQIFETKSSKELLSFIEENISTGISSRAKIRLNETLSNGSEDMYLKWAIGTSLAYLWIIGHELGHFFCGHLEYNNSNELRYHFNDRIIDLLFEKVGDHTKLVEEFKLKWSMELMADIYGINFLYMLLVNESKQGSFQLYRSRDIVGFICRRRANPASRFSNEH